MAEITERFVDSSDGVRIAVYEEGNPDGPDGGAGARLARFACAVGRRRPAAGRPVPHHALRQPRCRQIICAQTGFGVHDGVLRRRLRRGDRRRRARRAGARAGPRLGIGGDVGVPVAARRQRSRRVVHVGVRPERRSHEPVHHRQPQAAVPSASVPAGARPAAAVVLYGCCSPYPCSRRWSCARSSPMGSARMLMIRDGIPADQLHHSETYQTDAANSLKVYRANYFRTIALGQDRPLRRRAGAAHRQHQGPVSCGRTSTTTPRTGCRGCGAATSRPATGRRCRTRQVIARSVHEFVDFLEGKPASRALLRAQVGRPREYFGDTLVSVTGAGSGIGRETALAFAREGAEVVVSDIDEASVKDTAAQIAARGGVAHAYTLDVSDADAVERFAEQVCAEHGVPDIVVNNAGVGQAGLFLDTPARGIRPGARHQLRRSRQLLQVIWPPARRSRHRRAHRQRVLDGRIFAAAVDERVLPPARPRCSCSATACAPNWIRPGSGSRRSAPA